MSPSALTILLALHDGAEETARCLASLVSTMPPELPFDLVIVNDGTADATAQYLGGLAGDLQIVHHVAKRGRAASMNHAAPLAFAPRLLLLRQDAVLQAGFLEPLMACLDRNAKVAAVQPKAIRKDGHLDDAGGELTRQGNARVRGRGHPAPYERSFGERTTPDFATTSCLLVRRDAFLAVGGLDTHYDDDLYQEAHLTFALRALGWEVLFEPASQIVRKGDEQPVGKARFLERFADAALQRAEKRPPRPRSIAFFLPQFHPIPENDAWWGTGFTEWSNVVRAKPQFEGHHQPHLPTELGFYDLRVPETRQAQAALAKSHGVDAFCYYHYWFSGRRLLERPVDDLLAEQAPDQPFCLCWANEDWRANWDGRSGTILAGQTYSEEDDLAHIQWLLGAFADSRYVRVSGKPLFLVYRAQKLPDARRTLELFRTTARRAGIGELYLCRVTSFDEEHDDPREMGFDAAVEFQPDWQRLGPELPGRAPHHVFDYAEVVRSMLEKPAAPWRRFPCVTPRWDNCARRATGAYILAGSTPELYGSWLSTVVAREEDLADDDKVIFVNAWNEWAEGAHLEPCDKWGRAYLEAHREAIGAASPPLPRVVVRAKMADGARVLERLESAAEALAEQGRDEAALREAEIAADFAWHNHTGRFTSPRLERLLEAIAHRAFPTETKEAQASLANQDRVLHVLTEAHPVGGHTRFAWRWMQSQEGVRHSVALTSRRGRVPDPLIDAVRKSGGEIHLLDQEGAGLLDIARALRQLAEKAGLLALHIHPYDAAAVLALQHRRGLPKTVFVNHADHVFWLGTSVADVVANFRPAGKTVCVERRGIERSRCAFLPLQASLFERRESRIEAKRALGLRPETPVLLTVASAYKLAALDGLGYLDILPEILTSLPGVELFVVGTAETEVWRAASARTGGRIHAMGIREDVHRFQAAADLYVESYPTTSVTSLLESASYGTPIVRMAFGARDTDILDAQDPALDPHVVTCNSLDTLFTTLERLLSEPERRLAMGEATARAAQAAHAPSAWRAHLHQVLDVAAKISPARAPQPWLLPEVVTALDEHVCMLHEGTEMSQSLAELRAFHARK